MVQEKCLITSDKWYQCPIPITIFVIFLILFIYSLISVIKCSKLITSKEITEPNEIKKIFTTYILNIILTFISLLVIAFFIYNLIPKDVVEGVFNDYIGIIIVLYAIIILSITIHMFSKLKEKTNVSDINIAGGISLAISCIALILFIARLVLAYKKMSFSDLLSKKKNPTQQLHQ